LSLCLIGVEASGALADTRARSSPQGDLEMVYLGGGALLRVGRAAAAS